MVKKNARGKQVQGSVSCNEGILKVTKNAQERKREETSKKKDVSTQNMKLRRKKEGM